MMCKMNRNFRNMLATGRLPGCGRDGFTLVEIMMALMILTIGVLPIAVIQHQARRDVSEADRHTQGIQIAQMHLERIKGMGFGNTVAEAGQLGNVAWTVQVTNISFGMDRIDVTTTWETDRGQQSITISDLVSLR